MNLTTLIATRYLTNRQQDSNIAFMTKICFAGITIGTFSLMLTLIITNGFEKVIHEKIQGINSQIIISSPGNQLDYENLQTTLQDNMGSTLAGITGSSMKQVIFNKNDTQSVLFLKCIDPENDAMVTTLVDKIITPKALPNNRLQHLSTILTQNTILIGHKTALEHGINIGEEIEILIPEPRSKRTLSLKKHIVTIVGIFKIGLDEYDSNLAFTSLQTSNDLYDDYGVDQVSLRLNTSTRKNMSDRFLNWWNHDYQELSVIKQLRSQLPHLSIHSWKELSPALVASLKLEKYVMFFVLALITLVASMNMLALLCMQMQSKQHDMAILQTMGASGKQIRSIFLKMGMAITVSASTCGLFFAFIVGYLLEKYPCIELPDVYYVSHLPARIDSEIFLVVFCATVFLGFCATWIPAQRAKRITILSVLRQN